MRRFMVCRGLVASLTLIAICIGLQPPTCATQWPGSGPNRWISTGTVDTGTVDSEAHSNSEIVWHDNLEMGWKVARKLRRPMVIFITSSRCHYCDAMKRDTWRDQSVLSRMKGRFVAIRLSPDRNAEELSRIQVTVYPTTLIGRPEGKVVAHRVGYQPPTEMNRLLALVDHGDS